MPNSDETFMSWLRDAHAMEEQAEQVLSSLARRIDSYPELKSQVERHLEATRKQAERLRGCIERRKILIAAAGKVGDSETKKVLEEILREEVEMAKWLEKHFDPITVQFLDREDTPQATAKS